jgi:hypothetical protein
MALVALPAQIGGLVLQKILERFDPGQQTEVLKAALNLLEFTASRSSVAEPSAITEAVSRIVFVMGVLRSATSTGTSPAISVHVSHGGGTERLPQTFSGRRCI